MGGETRSKYFIVKKELGEKLELTSAGPDGEFGTSDDMQDHRFLMNFKTVGDGIKSNAREVSKEVAAGFIEGAGEKVSEWKDAWKNRKKESAAPKEKDPE